MDDNSAFRFSSVVGQVQFRDLLLQSFGTADEIRQKFAVDLHASFILGEISLVVGFQEGLNIGALGAERMDECLKHRDPVLRAIPVSAQSGEGKAMRCAVGEIELAVWIEGFVLCIGKAHARRFQHSVNFGAGSRFGFEVADADEVIEFCFAHACRFFSEPRTKIFG